MAAIITETFRRKMRDLLEADMIANPYYIGIGKSNPWEPNYSGNAESASTFNVPIPKGTPADDIETLNNLTSLIKITEDNISAAIPKIVWKSGNAYKAYNPYDESCFYSDTNILFPCYAINEALPTKPIFLCLRKGSGPSTIAPNIASYGYQALADGYVWAYVQDYINLDNTINSNAFIQIHKKSLSERNASPSTITACKGATGGKIYGFTVVNGGSGYSISSPPDAYISIKRTVTLANSQPTTLSGSFKLIPTVANVTINGVTTSGVITGWTFDAGQSIITLLSDESNSNVISASIEIIPKSGAPGGSGALIVPHISPLDGFGYHPSKDFPGWYMGVYSKFEDDTDDTFFTPYRQISIIRKPTWDEGLLGPNPPATLRALRWFSIPQTAFATINNFKITGRTIKIVVPGGSINPTIGYADLVYYDVNESRLYFHQCYSGGFGHIPATGNILIDGIQTSIAYTSVNSGEYITNTGEVVFTENRKPIERAPQQAEELKIIIQL